MDIRHKNLKARDKAERFFWILAKTASIAFLIFVLVEGYFIIQFSRSFE
jgi:hypothetical protein